MAIAEVTEEIIWLKHLVREMKYEEVLPAIIYSDNQAAVNITNNDVDHNKTKHIEIRHMYVREEIRKGNIAVCCSVRIHFVADIFTKALHGHIFIQHRDTLIKESPYSTQNQ